MKRIIIIAIFLAGCSGTKESGTKETHFDFSAADEAAKRNLPTMIKASRLESKNPLLGRPLLIFGVTSDKDLPDFKPENCDELYYPVIVDGKNKWALDMGKDKGKWDVNYFGTSPSSVAVFSLIEKLSEKIKIPVERFHKIIILDLWAGFIVYIQDSKVKYVPEHDLPRYGFKKGETYEGVFEELKGR